MHQDKSLVGVSQSNALAGVLPASASTGLMDYETPPVRVRHDLSQPFPRGLNPAHRHLRNQESAASASSKRSLINEIATKALGAPQPPKLAAPNGDGRALHPNQAFAYDYVDWATLTPDVVSEILASYRDAGMSPAKRNAVRSVIRGIATEAWMLDQISHATLDRIKQVKSARYSHAKRAGTAHSAQTIRALLDLCDEKPTARDFRDGLMIAMMAAVGLRRAETVSIQLKDIDFATNEITVEGKGQKQRTLTLPDCVAWRLNEYLDQYRGRDAGYLFNPIWVKQKAPAKEYLKTPLSLCSVNNRLERLRKMLPDNLQLAPHDLRRTCATDLREAGMSMREIQVVLGHASVVTTERYVLDETKDHREKAARLQSGRFGYKF
ncbi:tyrosine-type recombinase/integrase [Vreelandella alkaliphila]|uniref:Site-specific integrase n=1 Tax=Halomonas colorata TaxID=2742615 RepID=A0ABR9G365_9GAMM|nr:MULTISPECIES: site-specific integrase [Halomonas]MBE0465352.1 site-specific integrase [Halomonas colorata]